ncbi:hypothetical protein BT67DRAFT_488318 [Trichocladium antarcticum]|uniref:Xylanolytic transcriptional activator regulatory domain-containing protein n=1 Tax=Trichocladium antarcticum TaxID=1450529 RepID=A0AAN6UPB7_9PEZI|nr:hypothetical protein BT67DRAFT_488318 [Trichocladium antarcticum]
MTSSQPLEAPGSDGEPVEPKLVGDTHWTAIAYLVGTPDLEGPGQYTAGFPYISGTKPSWSARDARMRSYKDRVTSLSGAKFPFGSSSSFSLDVRQIVRFLPPRIHVDTLVGSYFRAFEPVYHLFHRKQFEIELGIFWDTNGVCVDAWLAQFLMMMVLGYQVAPAYTQAQMELLADDWTDRLLDAAQLVFRRSSYYLAPDAESLVPTMCLIAVAQMMGLVTGVDMPQLVTFMGFLTRSAMVLHLDKPPSTTTILSPYTAELRKRTWVTVQLLDLDVAMRTGTSYMHEDLKRIIPLNINDDEIIWTADGWTLAGEPSPPHVATDSTFQVKLAELLPILVRIVNHVNSPNKPPFKYEQVLAVDDILTALLRKIDSVLCPEPRGQRLVDLHPRNVQLSFFTVLINRTRLALHHHYVSSPRFCEYPSSSTKVLDAALVMLRIQQDWRPKPDAAVPGQPVPFPAHWLLDLCRDDFTAALLYYIITAHRQSLGQIPHWIGANQPSVIRGCLEVYKVRARRSPGHIDDLVTLYVAAGCLESVWALKPCEEVLEQVADRVEQTLRGRLVEESNERAVSGKKGGVALLGSETSSNVLIP